MFRPRLVAAVVAASTLVPLSASAQSFDGLPKGDARLVDQERVFGFDLPYALLDMSADGRYVAYRWETESGSWLGVIDLDELSLRQLIRVGFVDDASFSPDATEIAFVDQGILSTVDVQSREVSELGEVHRQSRVWWLEDRRLAYIDRDRRLVMRPEQQSAEETPLVVPNPDGRDLLVEQVSVSPDGSRAIYAHDCQPWIVDLADGTETALAPRPKKRFWGYGMPKEAWSPDMSHLLVHKLTDYRCKQPGGPGWLDVLYTGAGERIGYVLGDDGGLSHWHYASWSTDSKWLLLTMQPTGTQVLGVQQLWAIDLGSRTRSLVLADRVATPAFVDADRRLVVSRYDSSRGDDFEGAVVTGRLTNP